MLYSIEIQQQQSGACPRMMYRQRLHSDTVSLQREWVSRGLTSHSTLYRSFRGRFLQARWPQTVISNQMRPRRLRGAWFSRLLRHPARRRSGSILSPRTHTGWWLGLATRMMYRQRLHSDTVSLQHLSYNLDSQHQCRWPGAVRQAIWQATEVSLFRARRI